MIFNGADYIRHRDDARLTRQFESIFELMKDGKWRTLRDIELLTGQPQSSISAQLRHMRKPRFGGHLVYKRYIKNGLYEYKLIIGEVK